jgi:NitT/TauT family transport system ATP-binding protein
MLTIKNLQVKVPSRTILSNISFDIASGEIVSVIGPSGCGKTTLLNAIGGLLQPAKGEITLMDNNIIGKSLTSYMFQDSLLLPWKTIIENVLIHTPKELITSTILAKAKYLLQEFGLQGYENKYPSVLSGGMQRRVAFVRTLCLDRPIYLFDEPTNGLDYMLKLEMEQKVSSYLRNNGKIGILVTHDLSTATALSDRVILLHGRPSTIGKIFPVGISSLSQSTLSARQQASFGKIELELLNALSNANNHA